MSCGRLFVCISIRACRDGLIDTVSTAEHLDSEQKRLYAENLDVFSKLPGGLRRYAFHPAAACFLPGCIVSDLLYILLRFCFYLTFAVLAWQIRCA